MRVALATSYGVRCGIAEYANNLILHLTGVPIGVVTDFARVFSLTADYDIVHLNHEAGLFRSFPGADLFAMRQRGQKLVLTLHCSREAHNRTFFTDTFDRVVVHEKTSDGHNFRHIPLGIPEWDVWTGPLSDKVGIVGFPFNWKGFHPTAIAAQAVGLSVMAIMPESDHVSVEPMRQVVLQANPRADIITDWLPQSDVITYLSTCKFTCFPYSGNAAGISAAVRFGLSARRPIVLTRDRQFRDLFEYEDEIYFADGSLEATFEQVLYDIQAGREKKPARVIRDMCWSVAAQQYRQLYEELA